MSFILYNAPQSTCSQRVRFVLNAKGLRFEEKKLDLLAGDQLKPGYLALNPNGVVPTLDHDGAIVIDSSVIIEYLDQIAPASENFSPRDPASRSLMRAIVRMADLGQEAAWQDLPRAQNWYDAIRAHPAFKPTYYFGSLLTERFPHLRERQTVPLR